MSRGGPYRGAPGFFGTPQQSSSKPFNRGGHFSNPNYPQRGSFRGNRSRGRSNNRYPFSSFSKDRGDAGNGYFHPEMLEDPWKDLIAKSDSNLSNATSSVDDVNSAKMSDSMIPQVLFDFGNWGEVTFSSFISNFKMRHLVLIFSLIA